MLRISFFISLPSRCRVLCVSPCLSHTHAHTPLFSAALPPVSLGGVCLCLEDQTGPAVSPHLPRPTPSCVGANRSNNKSGEGSAGPTEGPALGGRREAGAHRGFIKKTRARKARLVLDFALYIPVPFIIMIIVWCMTCFLFFFPPASYFVLSFCFVLGFFLL